MPDKKKSAKWLLSFSTHSKMQLLTGINIIYYSVIPYGVSEQRIKTAFKVFNKI